MRILLVEDEKKVADMVARGLKAERFAVDVADDGPNGRDLAGAYDYDLIILDLMLPGMNGTELLRRIRRNDWRNEGLQEKRNAQHDRRRNQKHLEPVS
jgi:two-component system copper resistance phosphate regulon response regulator CusR